MLALPQSARRRNSGSGRHTEFIEFEDEKGHWQHEVAAGGDRPEVFIEDAE